MSLLPVELFRTLRPPPGSKAAVRLRWIVSRLWLFTLVPFIWITYAFFTSAGFLPDWPGYGGFHDSLADGFRSGKLSLSIEPAKELVRAKNPYDLSNSYHWLLDASYYKGKYYAYWGPVPAMFQAVGKTLLGIDYPTGDQYVQFFLSCVGFLFGALLIERIALRLFPGTPRYLVILGILAFAVANPTLHGVSTPSTYHTAIVAGQTWLVAGLLAAFDGVWFAGTDAARRTRLVLAGTYLGLSLASRVTLAPAIAIVIIATAWATGFAEPRRWRSFFASGALVAAPVIVFGCALLVYNKLRFESYFEFGINYQLAAFPLFGFSTAYVPANFYSYMLRPFETSCQFPYVFQVWRMGPPAFPSGYELPSGYMILEPVVGSLRAVPIAWLIPFAFLLIPRPPDASVRHVRVFVWCLITFVALGSFSGLVGLGVYGATMRYLGDVTSGIVLLGLLGGFALRAHRRARFVPRLVSFAMSLLCVVTIVFGVLLGYHGYNAHMERCNPELDAKIVRALSVCGEVPAKPPRYDPRMN